MKSDSYTNRINSEDTFGVVHRLEKNVKIRFICFVPFISNRQFVLKKKNSEYPCICITREITPTSDGRFNPI